MTFEEDLTIEQLSRDYQTKSQFDLVNYAIGLAVEMIRTGRGPRVKIRSENRASQVLAEMYDGKDVLNSIDMQAAKQEVS